MARTSEVISTTVRDPSAEPSTGFYSARSRVIGDGTANEKGAASPFDPDVHFAASVVAGRNLQEDIWACTSTQSVLVRDRETELDALARAYPVFLHLLGGGRSIWEEACSDEVFKGRGRKPKRGTEAVTAIDLVLRPASNDGKGRNRCSRLATILKYAASNEIHPEHFVASMKEVTLETCREHAARIRKSQVTVSGSITDSDYMKHRIKLSFIFDGKELEIFRLITQKALERLCTLQDQDRYRLDLAPIDL